jgi:endonuclease I
MRKITVTFMIFGMLAILLSGGCAKKPDQDISAAKSAVDALTAKGADKYAGEEMKMINDDLNTAMDEVKTQDSKVMKNYTKAKDMLAKVKADAETLKTKLPMKKEEAKNNALSSEEAAKTAVNEAKALLAKAPKGKGSRADIEALKADVKGLEESIAEVNSAIGNEDYSEAIEKANSIKEKSADVSSQIKQAMEKAGAKKK